MKDSFLPELAGIHPDWLPFLTSKNRRMIASVEAEVVKNEYTPPAGKVLRFLGVPLRSAIIVILGQDPYPQPGVATGRAFEVGTLQSWNHPFQNISLKNILRALYKTYTGKIISYNQLKEKFYSEFPILPPYKLFDHWERQGVLLLNTSFTCEPGKPGSHQKLWEEFSSLLLNYIWEKVPQLTWFVWGAHAAKALKEIPVQRVVSTLHPMMCYDSPNREKDFLFGKENCFEPFINQVDWTGYAFQSGKVPQGRLF